MIHGPGLGSAVHGDGVLGTVPGAEAAVDAAVGAGELSFDLFLDAGSGDDQVFLVLGEHQVVIAEGDGLLFAEVLAGAAEGAGGQIEVIGDLLSALHVLELAGDGGGGAHLDAHPAVDALLGIVVDAPSVAGLGGDGLGRKVLGAGP